MGTATRAHGELFCRWGRRWSAVGALVALTMAALAPHALAAPGSASCTATHTVTSADCAGADWLAALLPGDTSLLSKPEAPLTRELAVRYLYAALQPTAASTCAVAPFSDVAASAAWCPQAQWAKNLHVLTAGKSGSAAPGTAVSRGGFAVMLYRATHRGDSAPTCLVRPTMDVAVTSASCGSVRWTLDQTALMPMRGGVFGPDLKVTRAQAAGALYRLIGAHTSVMEIETHTWTGDRAKYFNAPRAAGTSFGTDIAWLGDGLAIGSDGYPYEWGSATEFVRPSTKKGAFGMYGTGLVLLPNYPMSVGVSDVVAVFGQANRYAIKSDGTLWTWGFVPGDPSWGRLKPRQVLGPKNVVYAGATSTAAIAVEAGGQVWTWSLTKKKESRPKKVMRIKNIVTFVQSPVSRLQFAGRTHFFLTANGTVWAWGEGGKGELGNGKFTSSLTPVKVSGPKNTVDLGVTDSGQIAALHRDGTVYVWGSGAGKKIYDDTFADSSRPRRIAGLKNIVQLVVQEGSLFALRSNGTVYGWGANSCANLGDGTVKTRAVPVQIPRLTKVSRIAGGNQRMQAITTSGEVWSWGRDDTAKSDGCYGQKKPQRVGKDGSGIYGGSAFADSNGRLFWRISAKKGYKQVKGTTPTQVVRTLSGSQKVLLVE